MWFLCKRRIREANKLLQQAHLCSPLLSALHFSSLWRTVFCAHLSTCEFRFSLRAIFALIAPSRQLDAHQERNNYHKTREYRLSSLFQSHSNNAINKHAKHPKKQTKTSRHSHAMAFFPAVIERLRLSLQQPATNNWTNNRFVSKKARKPLRCLLCVLVATFCHLPTLQYFNHSVSRPFHTRYLTEASHWWHGEYW